MDAVRRVTGIDFSRRWRRAAPATPPASSPPGELAARDLGWRMRHDVDDMVASAWRAWQRARQDAPRGQPPARPATRSARFAVRVPSGAPKITAPRARVHVRTATPGPARCLHGREGLEVGPYEPGTRFPGVGSSCGPVETTTGRRGGQP